MRYFFTADLHFGHENIIPYCGRPFKSVDLMNEALIRNWNSRVKTGDTVFHIGDFCFKNTSGGKRGEGLPNKAEFYKQQLNGDIIFIKGNHDRNNSVKSCIDRIVITYGGRSIALVHNPEWADDRYDINFVGHVHEKWVVQKIKHNNSLVTCINVGVDVHKFMPITFDEAIKCLKLIK